MAATARFPGVEVARTGAADRTGFVLRSRAVAALRRAEAPSLVVQDLQEELDAVEQTQDNIASVLEKWVTLL